MRRSLQAVLVLFTVASCSSGGGSTAKLPPLGPVPDGVRVTTHLTDYAVTSETVAELRREMMRSGPTADGVRYPGAARWNVRWTYQYDRQGIRCALREVRVTVDAHVEVPRWKPGSVPDTERTR